MVRSSGRYAVINGVVKSNDCNAWANSIAAFIAVDLDFPRSAIVHRAEMKGTPPLLVFIAIFLVFYEATQGVYAFKRHKKVSIYNLLTFGLEVEKAKIDFWIKISCILHKYTDFEDEFWTDLVCFEGLIK